VQLFSKENRGKKKVNENFKLCYSEPLDISFISGAKFSNLTITFNEFKRIKMLKGRI